MSAKLPLHEWCIIFLFCAILLVLAGWALRGPKQMPLPPAPPVEAAVLQIKIEGQVENPGYYRLPLHASLKDALEQARPLPTADLSQISWRRKLRDGQTLHIPERHPITIQLTGAVLNPGPLQIMSGTRCCELPDELNVLPEADVRPIRRKRHFLQDGEVIEVPIQKKRKGNKKKSE
jgi:SLBB domain